MCKSFKFFLFFLILAGFLIPRSMLAAEVFFGEKGKEWRVGDQLIVPVLFNTDGESINAIEGKIVFPSGVLELREIRDGNSVVNFWIDRPRAGSENQISFSGVTPGGYKGENGLLFSLVFSALKEGSGVIEIRDIKALKNDGRGTSAKTQVSNLQISISKGISGAPPQLAEDLNAPEPFVPEIANDPAISNGEWFIVFATQDKGTGVARYEIKETRQRIFAAFLRWVPAESPYTLKDQGLRSYVFVKAIDGAGNEKIATVAPKNPLPWYKNYGNWFIILTGIAVAYLIGIGKILWKKYIKDTS
jgi:hypothetical protein